MVNALLLIFAPVNAWDRISRAQKGFVYVLLGCVLPLLLVSSVLEAYGLVHWGRWQGVVPHPRKFPINEAVVFEAGQLLVSLFLVLLNAALLKSAGATFHGRDTYTRSFTTIAYGMSPIFLFRLLNASPDIPCWVGWCVGVILSLAILYHGVPRVMQPDPAHAFGLYVVTGLFVFMSTGLLELAAGTYLQGNFPQMEKLIAGAASRLPL